MLLVFLNTSACGRIGVSVWLERVQCEWKVRVTCLMTGLFMTLTKNLAEEKTVFLLTRQKNKNKKKLHLCHLH